MKHTWTPENPPPASPPEPLTPGRTVMHLHPRRHIDGGLCSPAENPLCPATHHYPKHRADGPTQTSLYTETYFPKHRARRGDEFVYRTTTPPRHTR